MHDPLTVNVLGGTISLVIVQIDGVLRAALKRLVALAPEGMIAV